MVRSRLGFVSEADESASCSVGFHARLEELVAPLSHALALQTSLRGRGIERVGFVGRRVVRSVRGHLCELDSCITLVVGACRSSVALVSVPDALRTCCDVKS